MKTALLPAFLITLSLALPPAHHSAAAADKSPPQNTEKKTETSRSLPFHGKLAAIAADGKSITVGKRVFQLGPHTKILQGKDPTTLRPEMIGWKVGGSYTKGTDGTLHALSLTLKPESEPDQKPGKKSPERKSSS